MPLGDDVIAEVDKVIEIESNKAMPFGGACSLPIFSFWIVLLSSHAVLDTAP